MPIEQQANYIFSLMNIPILIKDQNSKIQTFQNINVPTNLYEIIHGNRNLMLNNTAGNSIFRLLDFSELAYFSFILENTTIVIGPFLEKEVSLITVRRLSSRLKLINEDFQSIDSFYNALKILNNEDINFIYHIFHSLNKTKQFPISYKSIQAKQIKTSKKLSIDSMFEEFEYVKHNYEIEDKFTSIVERGDVVAAQGFDTSEIMKQLPKRVLNDSLRNAKTRLTILNTLCNRAAIRGGIDVQIGHQISTNYGILIESMKSIHDSEEINKSIIIEYATAVKDYSLKNYSKLIKKAINLIRQKITLSYNLQELSTDLFVTKEHLSRQFKKETNRTVSSFIGFSKVTEAKKLLRTKEYSISEVSNTLGFSNSTYFSKVFKQHTNITPMEYKKGQL